MLADGEPSRGGVVRWKWRQRRWQMGSPAATSSRLGQRAWHAAQLAWPTETVPQWLGLCGHWEGGVPCAALDHGDQQRRWTSGPGSRGGATAERAVVAGALGRGGEQGEPHRYGEVPCAPLGRGGQQAWDHLDGEVAAKTLSRGSPPQRSALRASWTARSADATLRWSQGACQGPGLWCGAADLGGRVTSSGGITSRAVCTTKKGYGGVRRRTVQRLMDGGMQQ